MALNAIVDAKSPGMRPGDVVWTWCSKHWDRTDHIWTGHKLVCLACHPEADPRRAAASVETAETKEITQ